METARSFVREVEVWTPKGTDGWHRSVADASGARNDVVATDAAFRARERLVSRTLATSRPEMLARGGTDEDVAIALPTFRAQRLASIVVLRCKSLAGRGGCIEVWEPNGGSDLVHAEGYYGALSDFEVSSRLARFGRGKGLPGIAWDRHVPHLSSDHMGRRRRARRCLRRGNARPGSCTTAARARCRACRCPRPAGCS
jgi:hypothetical protein